MNKKDRIAVVVSIFYFLLSFMFMLENTGSKVSIMITSQLLLTLPLFIYWSYRFIKNDISFLRIKDD